MLTKFSGCRQRFVQRNVYHYSGHCCKDCTEDHVVHIRKQQDIADKRAHRLGQAGQKRVDEGLAAVACGVKYGDRDGYAFGNVVQRDSQGNDNAKGQGRSGPR